MASSSTNFYTRPSYENADQIRNDLLIPLEVNDLQDVITQEGVYLEDGDVVYLQKMYLNRTSVDLLLTAGRHGYGQHPFRRELFSSADVLLLDGKGKALIGRLRVIARDSLDRSEEHINNLVQNELTRLGALRIDLLPSVAIDQICQHRIVERNPELRAEIDQARRRRLEGLPADSSIGQPLGGRCSSSSSDSERPHSVGRRNHIPEPILFIIFVVSEVCRILVRAFFTVFD